MAASRSRQGAPGFRPLGIGHRRFVLKATPGGAVMDWPLVLKLRQVDETLSWLVAYRRRCEDPGETLRICESIDQWLDERFVLMGRVRREGLASAGTSGGLTTP